MQPSPNQWTNIGKGGNDGADIWCSAADGCHRESTPLSSATSSLPSEQINELVTWLIRHPYQPLGTVNNDTYMVMTLTAAMQCYSSLYCALPPLPILWRAILQTW
ncbi:hypothetical protein BDN70DRAFT_939392 [Pholiota conissans]|uniref:Uncharacterized protein n=1 Tax=Pholiota conissans TaxID=109636 RepID=A0A9P6CL84_9AGAR|nr:hypothetical protein BDN70DRAFT_939392 [Pholiota conissans]